MKHRQLAIVLSALFLTACGRDALSNPTYVPTIASVANPTVIPTAKVVDTPKPTTIQITDPPMPTITRVPTTIPSATSPQPTPGPIKPILIELGNIGGDGGTSYDLILGRGTPSIILYTDGQLLISGERYGVQDWYVQKMLSVSEMCTLLGRIRAMGFFSVKGTGQSYPGDPIYQTSEFFGDGAGGYILHVNGKPSKWVFIYGPAMGNLVPEVKAVYQLISSYHPSGMKPFVPDRIILRVEQHPGEDWFYPTPPPPQPWPSELPPLVTLLKEQPEGREIVLEGQSAALILRLMHLPDSGFFTENSETYFVVGRPLLPHEAQDYYSVYLWTDSSFDLPFKCSE